MISRMITSFIKRKSCTPWVTGTDPFRLPLTGLPGSRSLGAASARRSRSAEVRRGQQFLDGGELPTALCGRLETFAERAVLFLDFG